ncbi:MAG TPA: class I SAM-dependent methyltransferase [Pyrinomonadaceae bacterium]|jgi:2-polyprenyl-3-methyl-5-hydroxy-6-metoxy-1,4-benzoquinol methylase
MRFEDVVLEHRACPLGCAPDDEPVVVGRDRLHDLPGEFQVVRCRACGLMRTDPRPTPETMGFYYPEEYGPYQDTRVEISNGPRSPLSAWKRSLTERLNSFTLGDHVPALEPGRMMEFGCASGLFLHRMAAGGWKVEGIEFAEKAAEAARSLGYRVHAGALEDAPDPEERYDLVVGWMVLEHLHEPVKALRKLHSWTRPGGWLAVSTPNVGAREFTLFKDAWLALHLPNHLYHYTPETLSRVLDSGGWQVREIFHQRQLSNLLASFGYVLKDRRSLPALSEKLIRFPDRGGKLHYFLYPVSYLFSLLGQTGRITVWAQRKDD